GVLLAEMSVLPYGPHAAHTGTTRRREAHVPRYHPACPRADARASRSAAVTGRCRPVLLRPMPGRPCRGTAAPSASRYCPFFRKLPGDGRIVAICIQVNGSLRTPSDQARRHPASSAPPRRRGSGGRGGAVV